MKDIAKYFWRVQLLVSFCVFILVFINNPFDYINLCIIALIGLFSINRLYIIDIIEELEGLLNENK